MSEEELNLLLGGSSGSADSLTSGFGEILGYVLIASTVLTLIIVVAYIFSMISRIRAERAMVAMRADVREIKDILKSQAKPPTGVLAAREPVEDKAKQSEVAMDNPITERDELVTSKLASEPQEASPKDD